MHIMKYFAKINLLHSTVMEILSETNGCRSFQVVIKMQKSVNVKNISFCFRTINNILSHILNKTDD